MKLQSWQKNVLSALFITVGAYLLFFLDFLLMGLLARVGVMLMRDSVFLTPGLFARILFGITLLIGLWFVSRSKLPDMLKATYFTLPLMAIYMTIGLALYPEPDLVVVGVGSLVTGAIFFYLYKQKLSWEYYFATIATAITALLVLLLDIQI